MYRKKIIIISTLFLIGAFMTMLAGCSNEDAHELDKVTVLLDWTPNTNYSGMYAALEEGFYADEGLDVELFQAAAVVQPVAEGTAQFGVSYQEQVTFARVEDIPVVSIAAIIQHNTSGFASLKDRGISTPADFEGKRYGGWGTPVEEATIQALMEIYNADYEMVEFIITGEVDSLIVMELEADFAWIYYGWTGVEAELKGMDLNFIELRKIDNALNYYTPVLIAGEKLINEDPELIKRFLRATAKGYNLAIENPSAAAEALLINAPELDRELVMTSQDWLKDKYRADASVWGLQEINRWHNYTDWLYDYNLIEEKIDVENAFTNDFLDR